MFKDFLDGDVEHRVLPGQVLGAIVLGKGDLDFHLIAGIHPDQLVLEARNKTARPQVQGVTFGLAAGEFLAIHPTDKINNQRVTVLGFSLLAQRRSGFLRRGQAFERFVHFGIAHIHNHALQLERREIHGLDFGHDLHRHGVLQVGTVFELADFDLRLQGRTKSPFGHGLLGRFIDRLFQHLAQHRRSVFLPQQVHRHFTWPETGHVHGAGQLFQPVGHLFFYVGRGDQDLEFPLQAIGVGFCYLHERLILFWKNP